MLLPFLCSKSIAYMRVYRYIYHYYQVINLIIMINLAKYKQVIAKLGILFLFSRFREK